MMENDVVGKYVNKQVNTLGLLYLFLDELLEESDLDSNKRKLIKKTALELNINLAMLRGKNAKIAAQNLLKSCC